MEDKIISKVKPDKDNMAIGIKSVQANSLYAYNNNLKYIVNGEERDAFMDIKKAALNDSLFTRYMRKHGVAVNKHGKTDDLVLLKFDCGVKDGLGVRALREYYYENGADITWNKTDSDGNIIYSKKIHYKMLMRSPGKAKEGDCIFIRDNLHKTALDFITMGLYDKMPQENAKIVELSAYETLVTATALDYITIPLKNILIVKDEEVPAMIKAVTVKTRESVFPETDIDYEATEELLNRHNYTFFKGKIKQEPELKWVKRSNWELEKIGLKYVRKPKPCLYKEAYVERKDEKVRTSNVLWDGMGLIDDSIFPENMEGFIYCRSHFFKSCLFRGRIQEYFKDNCAGYDTDFVKDMFGNQVKLKDIKVIITHNSIKWMKFSDLMGDTEAEAFHYYKRFMKKHKESFEIVKTAHRSKWGELQRSSYQINNSLPCTDKEVLYNIAKPSIDYCNALKTDLDAYMRHLQIDRTLRYSINNVLTALNDWNDKFRYTDYFKTKRTAIINKFKDERLKQGKLLQQGDNLVICGNPVALLMKATGQDFMEEGCFKQIEDGIECCTVRFQEGERLAGFRSPHNAPNNIVHLVNVYPELVQRYFPDLGDTVIIINGIGTDVQSRLNGQDLDTDAIFTTNQPDLVELSREAYLNYPTIINEIPLLKNSIYQKDLKSYACMDNTISAAQQAVGHASNIAQLALSYYYDGGGTSQELEDIIIICSVLAQVSIDSAKRSFDIDEILELKRLSSLPCMKQGGNKTYPVFFANIQKTKKKALTKKRIEIKKKDIRFHNCPMDILAAIIEDNVIDLRKHKEYQEPTSCLSTVFEYRADRKRDSKQHKKVIAAVGEYDKRVRALDEADIGYSKKAMQEFEDCMRQVNKWYINKATMSSLIDYAFSDNGDVRDRLLTVLYDRNPDVFLSCFKKTS